jgi:1-acyl-sn-glycerol-3-phosphate acyltransferase
MKEKFLSLLRNALLSLGRAIGRALFAVDVIGTENIPENNEPLIVISNHFSWFDPHILACFLPIRPVFLVATESQRKWSIRLFMRLFNLIPIWRGRVDRTAMRNALQVLEKGGVVGIFPEGGIDPEYAARVARGDVILEDKKETYVDSYGLISRENGELVRPRAGTAFLAVQTEVRILPVGLIGTERIIRETLSWRRLLSPRRPQVTLQIGQPFGPLTIDPALRGRDRRQQLDALADQLMGQIALLFPPEKRGPYRTPTPESTAG